MNVLIFKCSRSLRYDLHLSFGRKVRSVFVIENAVANQNNFLRESCPLSPVYPAVNLKQGEARSRCDTMELEPIQQNTRIPPTILVDLRPIWSDDQTQINPTDNLIKESLPLVNG